MFIIGPAATSRRDGIFINLSVQPVIIEQSG